MAKKKKSAGSAKSRSMILNKIKKGAPTSHKKHKSTDAVVKGASLPPGIDRGVAQLTGCKLDQQKTGKHKGTPYLSITGIVHEPADVRGLKATRTIFIRKTNNKSMDDKIADVYNDIKLLGGDLSETEDFEGAIGVLEALCEEQPFLYFHTWRSKPTKEWPSPQTSTVFDGVAEYDPETDVESYVEDHTDGEVEGSWADLGDLADDGDADAEQQLTDAAVEAELDPDEYADWATLGQALDSFESGDEEGEEQSLDELGEAADGGDTDAIASLTELATEAEVDPDEYEDWASLAEALA